MQRWVCGGHTRLGDCGGMAIRRQKHETQNSLHSAVLYPGIVLVASVHSFRTNTGVLYLFRLQPHHGLGT